VAELAGAPFQQNPGLTPSGVRLNRGLVSRASIIGVIINKTPESFFLDDSTKVIEVRSFDATPVSVLASVGDVVHVIGRPREYNGQRYLVLEICKRLRDLGWIDYRKAELELNHAEKEFVEAPIREVEEVVANTTNPFELIVSKIRELDAGPGADIEQVLTAHSDAEKFVRTLIEEGEIFEIKPGKLKVLE
jgi:hypothetical protein